MSTQINTYIILGARINYDDATKGDDGDLDKRFESFTDSAFEPKQDGMVCLCDGMSGEYIIVGHVLTVTDEGQHFGDPIAIDSPSPEAIQSIKGEITSTFGIEHPEVKTWIVSHYR